MNNGKLFLPVLLFAALASCRPKPLDIEVPQQDAELVISASCINESTVLVAAAYSVTSLRNLMDTSEQGPAPNDMLVDSAAVTIAGEGLLPDTLTRIGRGMYGTNRLQLEPRTKYTLTVIDQKKHAAATATTVYMPKAEVESIIPEVIRNEQDTIIRLQVRIKNVQQGDRYFMSYNTLSQGRDLVAQPLTSFQSFAPKRIELFEDGPRDEVITKTLTLDATPNDTLVVHIGRVDEHYYRFLDAYKRTGYLINQITGEPINLPTNISKGFGYFALYRPERRLINLNEY